MGKQLYARGSVRLCQRTVANMSRLGQCKFYPKGPLQFLTQTCHGKTNYTPEIAFSFSSRQLSSSTKSGVFEQIDSTFAEAATTLSQAVPYASQCISCLHHLTNIHFHSLDRCKSAPHEACKMGPACCCLLERSAGHISFFFFFFFSYNVAHRACTRFKVNVMGVYGMEWNVM